jgi:transcription antitermination factor NusG
MYPDSQYRSSEAPAFVGIDGATGSARWFAVHTHARHEKVVAQEIHDLGMTSFLPLVKQVRQWSDRRKVVEFPLFSCYVFVRMAPDNRDRLRVLQVNGVLGFVGTRGTGVAIPDEQIEAVRLVMEEHLPVCSHPFLKIGQHIRIRSGALSGIEGILVARSGEQMLVISLDAIQRSLTVRIQGYDVVPA